MNMICSNYYKKRRKHTFFVFFLNLVLRL